MTILAWLTLMLLLGLFFQELLQKKENPKQDPRSQVFADGAREVTLVRNKWAA